MPRTGSPGTAAPQARYFELLRPYQNSDLRSALWQCFTSFGLYFTCLAAMYASLKISAWLTFALTIPAGGLIVRIFMLQHDCGHNSLFKTRRSNILTGTLCSLFTLTPFPYWRRLHARHHGSWNNLDDRGIPADFFSDCATLAEYKAMTGLQKWLYRLSHHPVLMHGLLPPVIFILLYRVPFDTPKHCKKERRSVYLLDLALLLFFGGLIFLFGFKAVLLVHLPAMVIASIAGIWLFSVQHRFEDSLWMREKDWDFTQASLHGTSYLVLPRVLQWFSASIGLHHIHHLRPGIPNYRLQACQDECTAMTSNATRLSFKDALKAPSFMLWDEDLQRMVPFPS